MARSQESHGHAGSVLSTSPENSRHKSLKGLEDNRGLPKKGGAGSHNWGNFKDEIESESHNAEHKRTEEKVRVCDSEEFSKLHE